MGDQESPNEYFSRGYIIAMKMREMGVHKTDLTDLETNRHILRGLSSRCELVKLVPEMRDSLTRADLERMVLESDHEMERKGRKEEQGADRRVTGGDNGSKDDGTGGKDGRMEDLGCSNSIRNNSSRSNSSSSSSSNNNSSGSSMKWPGVVTANSSGNRDGASPAMVAVLEEISDGKAKGGPAG